MIRFDDEIVVATSLTDLGRVVRIMSPSSSDQRVAFLGILENLEVSPATANAKVIMNARTGSVVMNQLVRLSQCAVAHGSLQIEVRQINCGEHQFN